MTPGSNMNSHEKRKNPAKGNYVIAKKQHLCIFLLLTDLKAIVQYVCKCILEAIIYM